MRYGSRFFCGTMVCWLGIAPVLAAGASGTASADKPIPPFDQVEKTVLQYYEKIPGYRAGDLITQDQVEPLLKKLQKQGLPLEVKNILAKTPSKNEFIVRQLSAPNGRGFMRRIAAYPEGYDRLDRLSRLPQGRETVHTLIANPGGEKMIEYMTTAQGGKELGKMLSADPGGARFNAPTGRLYTVPLLLEELEKCRDAAVKAAEKKAGNE